MGIETPFVVNSRLQAKVEGRAMQRSSSNLRIWLVLLLVSALGLGSQAVEVRSTCKMSCGHNETCHSCCADAPACHLSVTQLLPISHGTSSAFTQPALLPPAVTVSIPLLDITGKSGPSLRSIYDLWPPPRELLTRDCILLL